MATTFALSHAMGSVSQGAATTSCYDPPAPIIEPRAIENVLSVTEDSHLQRLIKTAEKLQTDIDAIHPEKPSDAVLDAATKQIEVYLSRWSTDWKVAGYETSSIRKMQAYTKLKNRMLEMLKDLRSSGKIAYLTPEVRGLFGIDQYVEKQCKKSPDVTEECPDISGFYVPMTHTIFLDPKLSPEELAKSLLHELDHAYQYTYRLPVDITLLTGKAADKDFIDFQTFFTSRKHTTIQRNFRMNPSGNTPSVLLSLKPCVYLRT